jgi:hypothetical protein
MAFFEAMRGLPSFGDSPFDGKKNENNLGTGLGLFLQP